MLADWQERLAGLSDEQVLAGLSQLPAKWPPTVDEFRALCEGNAGDDWQHRTAAYLPFKREKAVTQKANPDKAKSAISQMKQVLSQPVDPREQARREQDAKRLLFGGGS